MSGLQREIDQLHAAGILPEPASAAFIRWLHEEFYADAPEALLKVRGETSERRMVPGAFRSDFASIRPVL
jgi:Fic family protein